MAKIIEYRDIKLDDLTIGQGQSRTINPGAEVEELAKSIEVQGLLQPIVVCPAREPNKWEILTGQRRYLAHRYLKRDVISAAILDERVEDADAKTISITENLLRRKLVGKDLKDGILYLYNIYGSVKEVFIATAIPEAIIRENLKYPRLSPQLKKMVDDGTTDVNAAVKAEDAATDENGKVDVDVALKLAREMQLMTGPQRQRVVQLTRDNPGESIDDILEDAKTASKVTQIVATVTQSTHDAIRKFAKEESATQNEATVMLIEESLFDRGLLDK